MNCLLGFLEFVEFSGIYCEKIVSRSLLIVGVKLVIAITVLALVVRVIEL